MGLKIDISESTISLDHSSFSRGLNAISEADLELTWLANRNLFRGVDSSNGVVWTFKGPDVTQDMDIGDLGAIQLSQVTANLKIDGGRVKFTLDGTTTNPDGSHPGLTLDFLTGTLWHNLFVGDDRLIGSIYDDEMYGRDGNDVIYGGRGDDDISGGTGNNRIYGGNGNDSVSVGNGNATIYGGAGNDTISSSINASTLNGGQGNDTINGSFQNDKLIGGKGADEIRGSYGDDLIKGVQGTDEIRAEHGNDTVYGELGQDDLYGGRDDDTLYGGRHDDELDGGSGDDFLFGGTGSDYIVVEDGSDTAYGGGGNDIIKFTDGNHVIYGGGGSELYIYDTFYEFNVRIRDFQDGKDLIRLDGFMFTFDDFQSVVETAQGVRVTIETGAVIRLDGMTLDTLTAADFDISDF